MNKNTQGAKKKRKWRLSAEERELGTQDPLTQVKECLACTKPFCENCVDNWKYQRMRENYARK